MTEQIDFRPLAGEDIPTMARWLADPEVAAWYEEGGTGIEYLTAHYHGVIEGTEATRGYIVLGDGEAIGYIQAVPIDAWPEYAAQLQLMPGSVGIDIFIGESAWRGRGIGSRVLRTFTERVVFGEMGAPEANIGPSPDNARAIRSYEKAGFAYLKDVEVTDEDEPWNTGREYVMARYPTGM